MGPLNQRLDLEPMTSNRKLLKFPLAPISAVLSPAKVALPFPTRMITFASK